MPLRQAGGRSPDRPVSEAANPVSQPPNPVSGRLWTVSEGPKVRKVMSLMIKGDFLMHGVVLQNRMFSGPGCPERGPVANLSQVAALIFVNEVATVGRHS